MSVVHQIHEGITSLKSKGIKKKFSNPPHIKRFYFEIFNLVFWTVLLNDLKSIILHHLMTLTISKEIVPNDTRTLRLKHLNEHDIQLNTFQTHPGK